MPHDVILLGIVEGFVYRLIHGPLYLHGTRLLSRHHPAKRPVEHALLVAGAHPAERAGWDAVLAQPRREEFPRLGRRHARGVELAPRAWHVHELGDGAIRGHRAADGGLRCLPLLAGHALRQPARGPHDAPSMQSGYTELIGISDMGGLVMGETDSRGRMSLIRPLSCAYLVWLAISLLCVAVTLGYTTLAYAGLVSTASELYPTTQVLGFQISVWVLIVASWVIFAAVAFVGSLFGIRAFNLPRNPGIRDNATKCGRIVFSLSFVDLLFSVFQQNATSSISSIVSVGLSGFLLLEVARYSPSVEDVATSSSKRSVSAIEAVSLEQALEETLSKDAKELYRLLRGYSTIMLVWGLLRLLSGVSQVFGRGYVTGDAESLRNAIAGADVCLVGIYLLVTGRYGKLALAGDRNLKTFSILSGVGLVISALTLIPVLLWWWQGGVLAAGDVFCVFADLALYAAGVFYARSLDRLHAL